MLIAAMGDLHLRNTTPVCRTDDYYDTMLRKFGTILKWCDANGCKYLIQPGDFFHSAKTPHSVVADAINLLLRYEVRVLVVYGQHDMRFHSLDVSNTPLNVLEEAGVVTRLLPSEPLLLGDSEEHVAIYGASWGEDFPINIAEGAVTIAVAHRMVIGDEKLWHDQKNFDQALPLLRKSKYDFICTGDNHQGFYAHWKDRWLVNCGSMMRSNADQAEHVPCFYTFNTEDGTVTRRRIPIKPFDQISTMEQHEDKKRSKDDLDAFIASLSTNENFSFNFKRNVLHTLEESGSSKELYRTIENIFSTIEIKEDGGLSPQYGLTKIIREEYKEHGASETKKAILRIQKRTKEVVYGDERCSEAAE